MVGTTNAFSASQAMNVSPQTMTKMAMADGVGTFDTEASYGFMRGGDGDGVP